MLLRRWTCMICSIVLMLAAGCAHAPPGAATTQPAAIAQDRDHVVIEAVLADLLAAKESPVAVRGQAPTEIRFAEKAATYPVTAQGILLRHDKEKWAALSPTELDAATEAANEIVRRHASSDGFKPFVPRDARVNVQAEPTTQSARSSVLERPVQAWPPGFTADGRYAIVFLSIPWSMHHANATYLLQRGGGDGWRIVLRQFVYYV